MTVLHQHKTTIERILFYVLVFLYIFNIEFSFMPLGLRSRTLIGLVGIVYVVSHTSILSRLSYRYVITLVFLVLWSLISIIINNSSDIWCIRFVAINILSLTGAIFLIEKFSINGFSSISKIIIGCIFINAAIAFIGMQIPSIGQWIYDIQGSIIEKNIEQLTNFRSRSIGFGIGNNFYGGVINAIGLILLCYLLRIKEISIRQFLILFTLLFFFGIFIARTSAIGLLGLFLLFSPGQIHYKKVLVALVILGLLYLIGSYLWPYIEEKINTKWAFEIYYNYTFGKGFETSSTNRLKEMYVFPSSIKTWLLGDAQYLNADNTYYMHTDVGYLRCIYYYGVIGLLIFLCSQVLIIGGIKNVVGRQVSLPVIFLLVVLIVNLKGFFDISPFLFLLVFPRRPKQDKIPTRVYCNE
ncbi:MAG: hypothetical protein IJ764_05290 [Bacteroidales bacterium]|nr:hypothetical protein [Bacteroidales bacterium]